MVIAAPHEVDLSLWLLLRLRSLLAFCSVHRPDGAKVLRDVCIWVRAPGGAVPVGDFDTIKSVIYY